MKTNFKKIIIITLTIFLVISLIVSVEAGNGDEVTKKFSGGAASGVKGYESIKNILSAVLGIVRTAGTAIAIVILMTIAAKYIMASAGDRADIKKYAVNYVIGAIILFGTSGILGVVQKFVKASVQYGSGS